MTAAYFLSNLTHLATGLIIFFHNLELVLLIMCCGGVYGLIGDAGRMCCFAYMEIYLCFVLIRVVW